MPTRITNSPPVITIGPNEDFCPYCKTVRNKWITVEEDGQTYRICPNDHKFKVRMTEKENK